MKKTLTVTELDEMINTAVLVRTVHLEDQITELRRMVNDLTTALGMVNGDIENIREDVCDFRNRREFNEDDVNEIIEEYLSDCNFATKDEILDNYEVVDIVESYLMTDPTDDPYKKWVNVEVLEGYLDNYVLRDDICSIVNEKVEKLFRNGDVVIRVL